MPYDQLPCRPVSSAFGRHESRMSDSRYSRRVVFQACGGALLIGSARADLALPAMQSSIARIETDLGGTVGVFAWNTGNGRQLGHRQDERFALCSTFKWVLAAAILASIDSGKISFEEQLAYGPADVLDHAPVTARHVADGHLTMRALCRAVITVSDNTAANLLLRRLGGPSEVTAFARSCGDPVTRLDRYEPDLNENATGDLRDTTTPQAMVELMQEVLCGSVLSSASRELLIGWLEACETGRNRLRAGLPQNWRAGDKTGSGKRGALNDVAIAFPPSRAPILIAAYMSCPGVEASAMAAAQAAIGRIVVEEL